MFSGMAPRDGIRGTIRSSVRARLLGITLALAASLGGAGPIGAASKDEDAVRARVGEFIALFNKHDAKAMSAFWVEDGSLVNPAGGVGRGPAEIEKVILGDP